MNIIKDTRRSVKLRDLSYFVPYENINGDLCIKITPSGGEDIIVNLSADCSKRIKDIKDYDSEVYPVDVEILIKKL